MENGLNLLHGSLFLPVQRLEILHIGKIVLHLRQVAHAGQHHPDSREARGKAHGVAGKASAMKFLQNGLSLLWQIHQAAALHRLHDDNGLAMLPADLIAGSALNPGVIVVGVVELNLHGFHLGVLRQNLIQHFRAVMEGKTHMAHLALGLQGEGSLIGAALFVMGIILRALGVHQVEVEIIHPAGLQLAFKEGSDIRLGFEEIPRQLVCQNVPVTGIPAGQAGLQRRLAFALQIAVGGVKIVEASVQKGIHHPIHFGNVHLFALHRQTHTAKAQLLIGSKNIHSTIPFRDNIV